MPSAASGATLQAKLLVPDRGGPGDEGLWVYEDEAAPPADVQLHDVVRVVEHTPFQRMVADRVHNPHGEHAEDVFELLADLQL